MSKTPHLQLPLLMQNQVQKHVTVNESLYELDGAVHCAVLGRGRNDPPANPADGDQYLVGTAPTGDWAGAAGAMAAYRNAAWWLATPRPGWRVYDLSEDRLYVLTSARVWTPVAGGAPTELQNLTRIGVGMTADPANAFAAKLNSALFTARTTAEGGTGNVFVTANKSAADRDAGFTFQSGFVTRAIAGLFGSNRFRIAVSADGAAFNDAISVHESSGIADLPRLPRFKAFANADVRGLAEAWVRMGVNQVEYNDQGAFSAATNRFTAPVAGTYLFGGSLMYKQVTSTAARLRGRLMLNGTVEIRGSVGEISGPHVTNSTALWLQTVCALAAGDTVELQGSYRGGEAIFAATHTTFWGCKIG
jgi:hypothetical protein